MTFETIIVEKDEGVCTITFNLPEHLNPWSIRTLIEFETLFDDLEQDDSARAVVITGKGRGFSSGADIRAIPDHINLGPAPSKERNRRHGRMARRLTEFEKPLIAAVNGVAAGAGLNIALCCDFVVASEQARFSEIFARRGLLPDFGGMWHLPRAIGLARAKELVFTGDIIDAREAERIGLVNMVVPHEELMQAAGALARELAGGPPLAFAMEKTLLRLDERMDLTRYVEYEGLAQGLVMQTEDNREGFRAFLEKRAPVFTGR